MVMVLEYCSVNEALVSARISQCLIVTVTSSISFGIVLILGAIEIVKFRLTKYYRYTRPLDLPLRSVVKVQVRQYCSKICQSLHIYFMFE